MITALEVNKIEANRDVKDPIANMKFNINFDNVKVDKENVEVAFTFTAVYEGTQSTTQVGQLKIIGMITSRENKKDAEEISTTWKEKKTLPLGFAEDVINLLNFECGARGTLVAYSIGFVAPIPLSRARLQETDGKAVSSG